MFTLTCRAARLALAKGKRMTASVPASAVNQDDQQMCPSSEQERKQHHA
jgi:hypothetical protein